jgi:DNA-binding NarL/FixJ family response regulator
METPGSNNRHGLTRTELAVLRLIIGGLADDEIAEQLGIDTDTVNYHLFSLLRKIGAKSRTEAAIRAIKGKI